MIGKERSANFELPATTATGVIIPATIIFVIEIENNSPFPRNILYHQTMRILMGWRNGFG